MNNLDIQTRIKLNDGQSMPLFGLGVFQTEPGQESKQAIQAAFDCGYRHVDTAKLYGNERDVGQAVKESGLPREEIFVTTKLWNTDHGYDQARRAFDKSLQELKLDYVDLYLIHWPVVGKRLESWRALIDIKKEGRAKSIGVSNFTIRHLQEFLENSDVVPAVNQVEFSPFLYQEELLKFCRENKIQLEAYAPLTRGERFDHPIIQKVAGKHRKSPAQTMIRWCLQHGLVAIPKSANPKRIEENADVFDFNLDADDMNQLDHLNEDLHTSWDPTDAP